MNAISTPLPCAICEDLLSTEILNECRICEKLICEHCSCECGQISTDQAIASALAFLHANGLSTLPAHTVIIEDEWGAVYGVTGPVEWFMTRPSWNTSADLESYLPFEFAGKHEQHQQQAVENWGGIAGYMTENYGIAIKRFDIEGRIFTVSVFHPYREQ